MGEVTDRAQQFMDANDQSAVVQGAAIGEGGRGAFYTLDNRRTFRLGRIDHASLLPGYPRWRTPQ